MLFDKEDVRAATPVPELFESTTGKRLIGAGPQRMALCPFHDDHHPSFSINVETGQWNCKACLAKGDVFALVMRVRHCTFREAVEWLGNRARLPPREADAVIDDFAYQNADRKVAYVIRRTAGKEFSTHTPDGRRGLCGADKMLYRIPELLEAVPGSRVFIVEGEAKVDRLRSCGVLATTNPFGAGGGWLDAYSPALRDLNAVILPDNDEPGRRLAENTAPSVYRHAASVKVVTLPGLPEKGDVSDWLALGHTVDELHALAEQAPVWHPTVTDAGIRPAAVSAAAPPADQSGPGDWPELPDEALYGVMGDIVRLLAAHSEADRAALLIQGLVVFGNVIGRSAHHRVGSDEHFGNLFAVIVGQTSKARKGTAWRSIRPLFQEVAPDWSRHGLTSGLASGEGLIAAVRDAGIPPNAAGGRHAAPDEGVRDKRLLVTEEEFSSTLRVMGRSGSILSSILRQAWDGADLHNLTKYTPVTATGAHISIIGHITVDELRACLRERTELVNGFANRFLWACVRRGRLLPFSGEPDPTAMASAMRDLRTCVDHGRGVRRLEMDTDAQAMWCQVYEELSRPAEGVVGAITSRAEAQVIRLALLYAVIDCARVIGTVHLRAALAVWRYCELSASVIFGRVPTGTALVNKIATALERQGRMTRDQIRQVVGGHASAEAITHALETLGERVRRSQHGTRGRPAEVWEWVGQ